MMMIMIIITLINVACVSSLHKRKLIGTPMYNIKRVRVRVRVRVRYNTKLQVLKNFNK